MAHANGQTVGMGLSCVSRMPSPEDMILISVRSTAYTGVNTKGGLISLRFCLGLVEAGFFVSVHTVQSWLSANDPTARSASLHEQLV